MNLSEQNWQNRPALPPSFYLKDSLSVAKALLQTALYVRHGTEELVARIVEVEAYLEDDPASHSYRGKTRRNWPMFEPGGTCYVYLSYGLNYCVNVVTAKQGRGEAVLIRAVEPLRGMEGMAKRRKLSCKEKQKLCSGPGKLTQAMGIDLRFNGMLFDREDFKIVQICSGTTQIGCSQRVGISKAIQQRFRFFVRNSPWLSRKEAWFPKKTSMKSAQG